MKLFCLATGSAGNCYILENAAGKQLLLECGIRVRDITVSPAFTSWKNISTCLITHGHSDHNLSKQKVENNGIETLGYHNLKAGELLKRDTWLIKSFRTLHNFDNSLGFLIKDTLSGKTFAFATDTAELPSLLNVDFWLVECNYDNETLDKAIDQNVEQMFYLGGIIKNHMSLEYLQEYFKREEIKRPESVIACHLSKSNANPRKIKEWLETITTKWDIAIKGKIWELQQGEKKWKISYKK